MGEPRIIAVDWSGAKIGGGAKNIALAEARDGLLLRLEVGKRSRDKIVEHLGELRAQGDRVVVGLDFGCSFPAWYLKDQGQASAPEMWAWLAHEGRADSLLSTCERPFWGLPGRRAYTDVQQFRRTERAVKESEDIRPKSVFQVGGRGSVGTGSIRGMCSLHALRGAGFAIWPFDDASDATVVEIYPRLFAPRVTDKAVARAPFLDTLNPPLPDELREIAKWNDDAFDAAVTAIAMSRHVADLRALPRIDDPTLRLEGIIWWPGWRQAHDARRISASP